MKSSTAVSRPTSKPSFARSGVLAWTLALTVSISGGHAFAVDFLRGDANDDREVSISDVYRILGTHSGRFEAPSCEHAADSNDDGVVDDLDASFLWNHLFVASGSPPPRPFPELGPEETPDGELSCESYGDGAPLEDRDAAIRILDAVSPGGGDERLNLRIAVSNSVPLAGFAGRIRLPEGVRVLGMQMNSIDPDLTGIAPRIAVRRIGEGEAIGFAVLAQAAHSPDDETWIEAGEDVAIVEIQACLEIGTEAGEYELRVEDAELIDADSALAIEPQVQPGRWTVESDVEAHCGDHIPTPPGPVAVFSVEGGESEAGALIDVPFVIRPTGAVQGYSFSLDFDEEVLHGEDLEVAWELPSGAAYDFQFFHIDNANDEPGGEGVDEGFIVGAALFDFEASEDAVMPADTDNLALVFEFRVRADAALSSTELVFLDGARAPGRQPTDNVATIEGATVEVSFESAEILVVPREEPEFVRGDSNGDGNLDLSDALASLGVLFGGSELVTCLDAMDADDDGTLNITDPIRGLNFLFLAGEPPPAPFPNPGVDPTEDDLGCGE